MMYLVILVLMFTDTVLYSNVKIQIMSHSDITWLQLSNWDSSQISALVVEITYTEL